MFSRKGDISISTVVAITLGLLVMVTMIYIFSNSSGGWGEATACPQMGGQCVEANACGDRVITSSEDELCDGNSNRPDCCPVGSF